MSNLTALQANALAKKFLNVGKEIGKYYTANNSQLTSAQKIKISEIHEQALDYADELFTQSANLVMDDVQVSLNSINTVTDSILNDYQKLKNVQKAINVASRVIQLASSILSKDTNSIGPAINGLIDAWSQPE
jgi:hypothetical protein